MAVDLETLKTEITEYLGSHGFVTFHGTARTLDPHPSVYWDVTGHPDFREFLETAQEIGSRLIVLHSRPFTLEQIDEALDSLEDTDLTREEQRSLELRLRDLQAYEGFTCMLELSFMSEGCIYLYEVETEWYRMMNEILDEIESAQALTINDEGEDPMSGYFSRN